MKCSVGIISLGCPRNLVDSELIISRLKEKGCPLVDSEKADIVIVNTCSFIKEAKEESIDVILDLIESKQKGKIKKIIVHGCLVQRYKDQLIKNLKEVDAFVGRLDVDGLEKRKVLLVSKHFAYVKLSEGCGNACSYCAIPKIKGPLKSRDRESILKEIQWLEKHNVAEINLVGQDISLYGRDICGEPRLADLVRNILKNSTIPWIRLLYLNPSHINDELIDLIASEKRICKYVDLPIQHINDRILKLMNRTMNRSEIISLIKKVRKRIKGVFIRTAIIVGFPSETEAEFKELLDFIKRVKFQRLGAFTYSREENTRAYNFKGHLSDKIKQRRFDEVMSTQQDIARKVNKSLFGKKKVVLVDGKDSQQDNVYVARTEYDAPEVDGVVYIKTEKNLKLGEFRRVKIVDTWEYDLVGELV